MIFQLSLMIIDRIKHLFEFDIIEVPAVESWCMSVPAVIFVISFSILKQTNEKYRKNQILAYNSDTLPGIAKFVCSGKLPD